MRCGDIAVGSLPACEGKERVQKAITDDLEEFRKVSSEFEDAVHGGKSRLFHERTTFDDLFAAGDELRAD